MVNVQWSSSLHSESFWIHTFHPREESPETTLVRKMKPLSNDSDTEVSGLEKPRGYENLEMKRVMKL